MIDMKRKPETKTLLAEPTEANTPEYPYGLNLYLDEESLTKLGIAELPAIDSELRVEALACVVNISQQESQGSDKPQRSINLQIEKLALTSAREEAGESTAQRLYAKSGMGA